MDPKRIISIFSLVFLLLTLLYNITDWLPHIPGDFDIEKPGIKVYIPFVSAIAISVILTIFSTYIWK